MSDETAGSAKGLILIVDDTLPNLRVLSDMLTDSGYKVRGAPNGIIALNAARTNSTRLIPPL